MKKESMLMCLICFVLGYLVARMMRGNGLSISSKKVLAKACSTISIQKREDEFKCVGSYMLDSNDTTYYNCESSRGRGCIKGDKTTCIEEGSIVNKNKGEICCAPAPYTNCESGHDNSRNIGENCHCSTQPSI